MSKIKLAINGFGRIGRLTFRTLLNHPDVEIVAVNDLTDNYTLAHLLRYDSAHGRFKFDVVANESSLFVDKIPVKVLKEPRPEKLPWKELDIDVVIESTGRFTTPDDLRLHIQAGARKVLLSAPAKGEVKTIVMGINDRDLSAGDQIISNASCTTNCLAALASVLHEKFGIEKGYMTTIHAITADQRLQDAPHKDLRRARAASHNIVPTSTGAARAIGLVLPDLKGRLDGTAMRVPVLDGSITELNCLLSIEATVLEINNQFLYASEDGPLKGILQFTDEPLVSSDIIGNPSSCIFDSKLTMAMGKLVRVTGWYDNEWGYSNRLAELAIRLGQMN